MNTNTERPVMLLDIDGVLNLFPTYGIDGKPTERVTRQTLRESALLDAEQTVAYNLSIPLDADELIAQLAEHYEMHWYTMWNQHARRIFTPLAGITHEFDHFECDWMGGADAFEASTAPEWMRKYIWIAKTPLIPKHVGTRPFCWIDDDSGVVDQMYLDNHAEVGECLLITVEPHSGLTQAVVDEAIEWARSLTIEEEYAS